MSISLSLSLWVNSNNLTATSLESWLRRGDYPQMNYYNLPRLDNGGYIFLGFFLFFFRIFFCFSVWSSFPCYLLLFGAKICVLHAFWS